jgi:translocation and assembly module TamB
VQAGSGDSSEVTIDLDITENLKARGAAGADGETSIGIFYERDY